MRYNFMHQKKGFTLVEILVVVAIIGILSTIILFAVDKARAQGRDTARIAAIGQLQVALKLYYDEHGSYPNVSSDAQYPDCAHDTSFSDTGCMNVLVKEKLIQELPTPINGNVYYYDNWCKVGTPPGANGTNVRQYRVWVYGETDRNAMLENWWHDTDIGATTCVDPS